jgi:triosephosphate isomerase
MRRRVIAGNWKMNTTLEQARALASEIAESARTGNDIVICPPFPWLVPVGEAIAGSQVKLGAQNCWTERSGAFTGEVSPAMLRELCTHVIVGHSERRVILGEGDELIAKKIRAALGESLTPIVCVGESIEIREAGEAESFVVSQVHAAFNGMTGDELRACLVAYEPIWAIGTGRTATVDDCQAMCAAIRNALGAIDRAAAQAMPVLYGGSVTPANFAGTIACDDVDGALVGGASLKSASFLELIAIAAN